MGQDGDCMQCVVSSCCRKASWVWRLVCWRALSFCRIESLSLWTCFSLSLRALRVGKYRSEFTVWSCSINSRWIVPSTSHKTVNRTFCAESKTLNLLGLGWCVVPILPSIGLHILDRGGGCRIRLQSRYVAGMPLLQFCNALRAEYTFLFSSLSSLKWAVLREGHWKSPLFH